MKRRTFFTLTLGAGASFLLPPASSNNVNPHGYFMDDKNHYYVDTKKRMWWIGPGAAGFWFANPEHVPDYSQWGAVPIQSLSEDTLDDPQVIRYSPDPHRDRIWKRFEGAALSRAACKAQMTKKMINEVEQVF